MSKKKSSSPSGPSKDDQAPDLSALDFGPAWAREDASNKPKRFETKHAKRESKGYDAKGHEGKRKSGPRRGGGQKRGQDRRQGGRSSRHDRGGQRVMTPPAEGVSARIMPIEEGMDALAKEISAQGRTHSVFDLAWLILGGLDRFHIIFEREEEPLYQCQKDHAVWLTKSECLRHFWSSGMVKDFYEEQVTEGEAPAGNFQSVARCGLSGQLIGPPNHHSYQQTLLDLYRERFAHMSFDHFKSKIVMEHGEEVLEQWVEQEKKQLLWRPKAVAHDAKEEEAADEDDAKSETITEEITENKELSEVSDEAAQEVAEVTEDKSPGISETVPVFKTRQEVDQHFQVHGFEQIYTAKKHASVLANISRKLLSPGLVATLKHVVAEEKRYPGKLASFLCRQMSGRHLAVFKWKKRLHCGPARPKHVSDDLVMADRPAKLFHWVLDHPSGSLDKMWQDCLPEGIEEKERHVWYHDLHWLINEGLVLLFSDGSLHAAKEQRKLAAEAIQGVSSDKLEDEKVAEQQEASAKESADEEDASSDDGQDTQDT